jgi:hypothetical protein
MVGIATISPIKVVTRALPIPPANWSGRAAPAVEAIWLNDSIMPKTVPVNPSIGAMAPITPSTSVLR